MGSLSAPDLDALLAVARKNGVAEFRLDGLSVKFVHTPLVEERKRAEPETPASALELLGRSFPEGGDVVQFPGSTEAMAAPRIEWAEDDSPSRKDT